MTRTKHTHVPEAHRAKGVAWDPPLCLAPAADPATPTNPEGQAGHERRATMGNSLPMRFRAPRISRGNKLPILQLLAVTTTAGPDVIAVAVSEPGVPDANSTHPTTKGDCPCPETNAA